MKDSTLKPIHVNTYTGHNFDLWQMAESDVVADDIAVSLSRQNRYAGHSIIPWSVAQHSILCSMIADKLNGDKSNIKACFMHDFEEAYVQDIIFPLKSSLCVNDLYEKLSERVSKVIFDTYNCHGFNPQFVKIVDQLAYCFEWTTFHPNSNKDASVSDDVWKKFKWLANTIGMGIPEGLIEMSVDQQAETLFEFMIVQQAEKAFGKEIASSVDSVVNGINTIHGKNE